MARTDLLGGHHISRGGVTIYGILPNAVRTNRILVGPQQRNVVDHILLRTVLQMAFADGLVALSH